MCPSDNENLDYIKPQGFFGHLETIEEILETNEEVEEIGELEEIEDEGSPASSPMVPPPPSSPTSTNWLQHDFDFFTNLIENHLTHLEKVIKGPHIIVINNPQHLRPINEQNWKEKINRLLFEMRIPYDWVIDCLPANSRNIDNDDNCLEHEDSHYPHCVEMFLSDHAVKVHVFKVLDLYLKNEYNNIVCVE